MASVSLLALLVLCVSVPARAQDTRTDQAGSVLREYVDKGYCTYTYVVPPGSRTEGCTPPGQTTTSTAALERQLAETKEETGRLKNQVDRLSSMVGSLLGQQSDLTSKVGNLTQELQHQRISQQDQIDSLSNQLSKEKIRSDQLEQNLTRVELELDNLTTTVREHGGIIKQGVKCYFERPDPEDNALTTDEVSPTKSLSTSIPVTTIAVPSTDSMSGYTTVEATTVKTSPNQAGSTAGASTEKSKRLVSTLCLETSAAPRLSQTTQSSSTSPGAPDSTGPADGVQVRLADGSIPVEGRVEVRNGSGQWGSVCDDNFDLQDAHVVCRQLGFGTALEVKLAGHFGEGSGNVWLDEVACRGDETNLGDCPADSWGRSDCSHKEDVGVVCEGGGALRLVGGLAPWEGRLEFRPWQAAGWGTVCNTSWTEAETELVCRRLGYTGGASISLVAFGEGTGRIWLGDVTCSGEETNILSCGFTWEPSDCDHSRDVAVVCTGGVSVRLAGSQSPSQGRVQVRSGNGDWGTICDDGFDDRDAQVVCRQLGLRGGVATAGGVYPEGTGNIWLDNLNCAGNESSVADCQINRWGDHDCTHKEDAGVVCVPLEDCAEYNSSGRTTSGVYRIGLLASGVEAYCDMDTAGGGWTVIQRRQDGSVPFNRTWEEYKQGFGNKNGEYWLGNENIHLLTNQKSYRLRMDLLDWNGDSGFAEYSSFRVSGESDQYRLHVAGFTGNAGDSMAHNNGRRFSTVDKDNDDSGYHCSQRYGQAGWWFRSCSSAFLNGRYLGNCGSSCPGGQGVVWNGWRGYYYSLKSVSMKIRPY